jgi:peptidoglycan/LPS O-acetylase OafA/YrhL
MEHAIIKPRSVYLPNLNAIRFIAALLVIIRHIEQNKALFDLPFNESPFINIIGKLGVVIFFVLSGFLISYLLFKEQDTTQTISIKDFYIRRILRIWPLYFLVVLSALFIIPFIPLFSIPGFDRSVVWHDLLWKTALYVLFLPNMAVFTFSIVPFADQSWSIGAEEQFYLIWPVLNKKFKKKKWLLFFIVIAAYLLIRSFLYVATEYYSYEAFKFVRVFWSSTPIDCMAIGGLFALIGYRDTQFANQLRSILFKRWLQWSVLLITIVLIARGFYASFFHFEFYSLLFGILILNFALNDKRIFSMENKVLNYLGKISYGLYMYHMLAIVLCIKALTRNHSINNYTLYPLAIVTTIAISSLSYYFFENWFIRRKRKYSVILSGDNVKD